MNEAKWNPFEQTYQQIVEQAFGPGSCNFQLKNSEPSPLLYELHNNRAARFASRFYERLNNLATIYPGERERRILLTKIKEAASSRNWEGAYSELIAYEYLNQGLWRPEKYFYAETLQLENVVQRSQTFSRSKTGTVNIDGLIDFDGTYFEIKALKDSGKELLENICSDVKKRTGTSPLIGFDDTYQVDFQIVANNREKIVNEIIREIERDPQARGVRTSVGIVFRLRWERPSVMTSSSSVSPFSLANHYHRLVFNWHDQILKNKTFILVLVNCPFFNNAITSFSEMNKVFYRAYARRVFCQYLRSRTKLSTRKKKNNYTLRSITRGISGILFLEDKSVEGKDTSAFCYLNPNAKKRPILIENYFRHLKPEWTDHFWDDNY